MDQCELPNDLSRSKIGFGNVTNAFNKQKETIGQTNSYRRTRLEQYDNIQLLEMKTIDSSGSYRRRMPRMMLGIQPNNECIRLRTLKTVSTSP